MSKNEKNSQTKIKNDKFILKYGCRHDRAFNNLENSIEKHM